MSKFSLIHTQNTFFFSPLVCTATSLAVFRLQVVRPRASRRRGW
ncbi:unnamed protein product [Ixodes pacificus]